MSPLLAGETSGEDWGPDWERTLHVVFRPKCSWEREHESVPLIPTMTMKSVAASPRRCSNQLERWKGTLLEYRRTAIHPRSKRLWGCWSEKLSTTTLLLLLLATKFETKLKQSSERRWVHQSETLRNLIKQEREKRSRGLSRPLPPGWLSSKNLKNWDQAVRMAQPVLDCQFPSD